MLTCKNTKILMIQIIAIATKYATIFTSTYYQEHIKPALWAPDIIYIQIFEGHDFAVFAGNLSSTKIKSSKFF